MLFLGIDLGGENNTWVIALKRKTLEVELIPFKVLKDIVSFCEKHLVLGVGIDAPLTFGLEDEKGFRKSDEKLKKLLPQEAENWILSYHSLQAIPIRGKVLAEALSPIVGTILETHPRSSLYFLLPEKEKHLAFLYKNPKIPSSEKEQTCEKILDFLKKHLNLKIILAKLNDGIIDALVCAITAYFFHNFPEKLEFLSYPVNPCFGRGPFVIIKSL